MNRVGMAYMFVLVRRYLPFTVVPDFMSKAVYGINTSKAQLFNPSSGIL
jgi:hypothetical protein